MTKYRYANVNRDDQTWSAIVQAFRSAVAMSGEYADEGHCVAIASKDGLGLNDDQWNGKMGGDAFALAMAVLVMSGEVKLIFPDKLEAKDNALHVVCLDSQISEWLKNNDPKAYQQACEAIGYYPNRFSCENCGGRGWPSYANPEPCDVCQGSGYIELE